METRLSIRKHEIITVVGFALYLVTFSGGPFQISFGPEDSVSAWSYGIFAQLLFFTGIVLGCHGARKFLRLVQPQTWYLIGFVACVACTIFGFVVQIALDNTTMAGVIAQIIVSISIGAIYAQPLLFWLEALSAVSEQWSRFNLAAVLLVAYLLLPVVIGVSVVASGTSGFPIVMLVGCAVVGSLLAWRLLKTPEVFDGEHTYSQESYHVTPYIVTVLVCFGFSWGIAEGWNIHSFGTGWLTKDYADMFAGFVVLVLFALLLWVLGKKFSIRFGMLMRLIVVVCGFTLTAIPLALSGIQIAFFPLCELPMVLTEISVFVLTLEMSRERRLSTTDVFTSNYTIFVGAAWAAGLIYFGVFMFATPEMAADIITLVAICAVLAVIPVLPSNTSNVVTFAQGKLPEEESREQRIAQQKERLSLKFDLTKSEAEVLDYLLQGMNREQIAQQMYLSPWTIKARIAAIYKKCDVHSYKELVRLASSDEN